MIYKKVKRFFGRPTQVAFLDAKNNVFIGGIADDNRIICLKYGNIIKIDEYLDDVEENCPEIAFSAIELDWCNLSDESLGDASTGETVLS